MAEAGLSDRKTSEIGVAVDMDIDLHIANLFHVGGTLTLQT
jgi:hypothetical protein